MGDSFNQKTDFLIWATEWTSLNKVALQFTTPGKAVEDIHYYIGAQVTPHERNILDIVQTLRVLEWSVILCTILFLIVTFIFLRLSAILLSSVSKKKNRFEKDTLFGLFATALNQDHLKASSKSQRICLFTLMGGFFMLVTVSMSQMSTDLISVKPPALIDTMEELAATERFPVVMKGSGLRTELENSKDPAWQRVWSRRNERSIVRSTEPNLVIDRIKEGAALVLIDGAHEIMIRLYCIREHRNLYHRGEGKYMRSIVSVMRRKAAPKELGRRLDAAAAAQLEFGLRVRWNRDRPVEAFQGGPQVDYCVRSRDYLYKESKFVEPIRIANVWRSLLAFVVILSVPLSFVVFKLLNHSFRTFLISSKQPERLFVKRKPIIIMSP